MSVYRSYCKAAFLFVGLSASVKVEGQLNAGFTADKTGGCSPLTVSFTNTTTGASPGATYTWQFGNGNSITTGNPSLPVAAVYYTAQAFTVALTVNDGGVVSTHSAVITVYKNPVVSFTISNPTGCQPLNAAFNSTSLPGDGSIANFFWDFGDGQTTNSAGASVNHSYSASGVFTPGLTVTNSFGCSSTAQEGNAVAVIPTPTAAFTAVSTALCQVTDAAIFQNNSTGSGPLTYSWVFGDGQTSTAPNPSHIYSASGAYTVQLTVTSAQGCSNTLVRNNYINVAQFNPAFSLSGAADCAGSVLNFQDQSTPAPTGQPQWSFGDGTVASGSTVSHTYLSPGSYTVSLSDSFGQCPASVSQSVTIDSVPVIHGFIVVKSAVCQPPALVQFSDTASGDVKWAWNFTGKPGDTSTLQNPSFTFLTDQPYTTSLTVTNAGGCSSTVSQQILPSDATALIGLNESLTPSAVICADVTINPSVLTGQTMTSYNWSFGDGSSSTAANPSHIYTVPGMYLVTLNFTTASGCTGTAGPDTVNVYPKPHAAFTALDSAACMQILDEQFTNLSKSAAQYYWIYGDGNSAINNSPVHYYTYGTPQSYTMTLIASSPGCASDTAVITRVLVTSPAPGGAPVYTCVGDRATVTLTDSASGGTEYVWNWGDGSANDTDYVYLPQRSHTYAASGVYSASITGTFPPCVQSSGPISIYVLKKQQPLLSSPDTVICGSGPLPVLLSNLDTNYRVIGGPGGNFYGMVEWQYGDGSDQQSNQGFKTSDSTGLTNLKPGEDSIRAIIQSNIYGCQDTSNFIPVRITGPAAAFSVNGTRICFDKLPLTFTDHSSGSFGVPIVSWTWNFGDSITVVRTTGDTVMHAYALPGTYSPTLTVTDSAGCSSTVNLPAGGQLDIEGPKAAFSWSPINIVPGQPVSFYNRSVGAGGTTYQWYFYSDGSTSSAPDSLTHVYGVIPEDTVRLIALPGPSGGCPDTLTQVVIVAKVTASFTYTTQYLGNSSCPPAAVSFSSNTFNAVRMIWNFGDSSFSTNPNPSHTYLLPGIYTVSLTAYGPGNDSVSFFGQVVIKGPFGILHSSLMQACIPATDTLHSTATNASGYTWDFGDGTVLVTADTLAVHTYLQPGIYSPALLLNDTTGCQASFQLNGRLVMDSLHVLGDPYRRLCDTGMVSFNSRVYSLVADSLGEPLSYLWNFGTPNAADTATAADTSFDYTARSTYLAQVQVSSPAGCVARALDTVFVVPPLTLRVPQPAICAGDSIAIQVQGAATYQWLPANGLSDVQAGEAIAKPDSTTEYRILATDRYGCITDTAVITVTVNPLPTIHSLPVVSVPAGSDIQLLANASDDVVSWNWSPPDFLSCTACASPVCTPNDPTTYTVLVTNANGCTASDTVFVRITCSEGAVHVPNAFTPNHDGRNDVFRPLGRAVKAIKHFAVYSRWGQCVYSVSNMSLASETLGWDGTFNGQPMPMGTYVYYLEIECFTGETYLVKGTVELIR